MGLGLRTDKVSLEIASLGQLNPELLLKLIYNNKSLMENINRNKTYKIGIYLIIYKQ